MRSWLFIVLVLAVAASPKVVRAQAIQIDVRDASLMEALAEVRTQTGIDIVFAHRRVEDQRVTCRYEGPRSEQALDCVLEGTGLRAERVRRRQYVIVAEKTAPSNPPQRGALVGYVADAETGEVLPGAHVYLSALSVGATTNEAGYFALPGLPEGQYQARISYLGYRAQDTLLAVDGEPKRIHLKPETLRANELVVEADRRDRSSEAEMPGHLTLVPGHLAEVPAFLGEQDLLRALQWRPGLHRSGEVGGGLSTRGGQIDQNLYLLDGVPVYHPWHAFSLISTFQSEVLKSARFYRSAFPAEHGGRLSAVLDAQMKDGSREKPQVTAALSPVSGRFLVESPVATGTSLMIAGRHSYLDRLVGREHPVEEAGRSDTLRTGYYFYDLNAKLTTRPAEGHRLSLSYYHGRDDLDLRLPLDLSLDSFSSWRRPAEFFFEVGQRWENHLYSARYQYLYSDALFVTTTAYYSGYRASERAWVQPTTSASLNSNYRVRLEDLGVKVDLDYYPALAHQLRAGVQVVGHRFESALDMGVQGTSDLPDRQEQQSHQRSAKVVAYVQDEWRPTPRWKVLPGLRASFFSNGSYTRLTPRLSVQYAAHPRLLMLRGAADMHVQYMRHLRDRYSLAYDLASSRWIPAGEEVPPATSRHVTLEAESRPAEWLSLRAGIYGRQAQHVLVPRDEYRRKEGLEGPGIEMGILLGQYVPAQARAYGVEAETQLEHGPWQAQLSYTGGRSLIRSEVLGEERFRPDRFDLPRVLRGTLAFDGRQWTLALATEWRSGYPHTVPMARYELSDPLEDEPTSYLSRPRLNNGRLPSYLRLDATVGRRFEWVGARWTTRLHLYNALNRRNVIGRQYLPQPDAVEVKDRRGLPILPLLELEMTL